MAYTGVSCEKLITLPKLFGSRTDRHETLPPSHYLISPQRVDLLRKRLKSTPIGFDVTVGTTIFETDFLTTSSIDLVRTGFGTTSRIQELPIVLKSDKDGKIVYYVESREEITLPSDLELILDARSTTGRVGVMCHQIGDSRLDSFLSKLIFAVQPRAFPLLVTPEITYLAHAVVRKKDGSYMTKPEILDSNMLQVFVGEKKINLETFLGQEGLPLHFSTHRMYAAKECDKPIDMFAKDADWRDYFELLEGNNAVTLEPDRFYLMGAQERLVLGNICGRISREHSQSGTGLWGHFAGWINPGFCGEITLEVLSQTKRIIHDGDPAGFVMFDRVEGEGETTYSGSYQNQTAPRLPKVFAD